MEALSAVFYSRTDLVGVQVRAQSDRQGSVRAIQQLGELIDGEMLGFTHFDGRSLAEMRDSSRKFRGLAATIRERLTGNGDSAPHLRRRMREYLAAADSADRAAAELETGTCTAFKVYFRLSGATRAERDLAIRILETDPRVLSAFAVGSINGKLLRGPEKPRRKLTEPPTRPAPRPMRCDPVAFSKPCLRGILAVKTAEWKGQVDPHLSRILVFLKYQGSYARTLAAAIYVQLLSGGTRAGLPRIASMDGALEWNKKLRFIMAKEAGRPLRPPSPMELREDEQLRREVRQWQEELKRGICPGGAMGIELDVKTEKARDAIIARLAADPRVGAVMPYHASDERFLVPRIDEDANW
jgi:hypothetical protein